MNAGNDDDVLAGVLIQIAAHAEKIGDLEMREASRYQETASQLRLLREHADGFSSRVNAITTILGRHASVVDALDGLDRQVALLVRDIAQLTANTEADTLAYQPEPAPSWWHLAGTQRETAADRLRAWVEQIYQPSYGHLAAALPACWEQHSLCLFTLDWLSELWSVLYLSPHRTTSTLASQAEWQTRLLPAAASQMTRETAHCEHINRSFHRPAPRQSLPARDDQ